MLESKSEELKKALEKSMSKENIQEKLMQEKLKQDQLNKEREKQKRIFYVLITVFILIIIALSAYLLMTNENSKIAKNKEFESSKINPKEESTIEKKVQIDTNRNDKQTKQTSQKIKEKIVTKEVIVQKEVFVSKDNFKEIFNTKNFNLVKCYSYGIFEYMPTNACKKSLTKFLEDNKKAIRLELIGVVGIDDIKKANSLAKDEKIQEYIIRGIARDRVIEASWFIKELLKDKNAVITPVNYYIKSKKNNKGLVLRAYN